MTTAFTSMSDAELVTLALAREDAAFAEIVRRHRAPLYRLARASLGDADDALDATVNDWAQRLAAKPAWAVHMTKTQFRAYAQTIPLGDVTEADGDLLAAAVGEDPSRFVFPGKRP